MPSSKRDLIKRKHVAIHNSLEKAMGWTQALFDQFQEHHPEYSEGYANVFCMIQMAQESIDKMKSFI